MYPQYAHLEYEVICAIFRVFANFEICTKPNQHNCRCLFPRGKPFIGRSAATVLWSLRFELPQVTLCGLIDYRASVYLYNNLKWEYVWIIMTGNLNLIINWNNIFEHLVNFAKLNWRISCHNWRPLTKVDIPPLMSVLV